MPAMDYPEDVARKNQVLMRFFPIMDPDPVTPSSKAGLNSLLFVYYEAVVSLVRRDAKQGTKLRTRPSRPRSNDLRVTGASASPRLDRKIGAGPVLVAVILGFDPSARNSKEIIMSNRRAGRRPGTLTSGQGQDIGTAVGRGLAGFSCGPPAASKCWTVHTSDLRQKTWGLGGLGGQRRRI
ncbi:hypothetical protein CMUS01_01119 [Colletotrichum musicola]|uniref:Uncharacterized protein n=1 Tax=Colletotrichum musicola TaxID=2175873 RepID=A0A8H6NXG8_9PEZI|nr:hypothetical protein CMUS01_01119 [Colletotrichum musicola]